MTDKTGDAFESLKSDDSSSSNIQSQPDLASKANLSSDSGASSSGGGVLGRISDTVNSFLGTSEEAAGGQEQGQGQEQPHHKEIDGAGDEQISEFVRHHYKSDAVEASQNTKPGEGDA